MRAFLQRGKRRFQNSLCDSGAAVHHHRDQFCVLGIAFCVLLPRGKVQQRGVKSSIIKRVNRDCVPNVLCWQTVSNHFTTTNSLQLFREFTWFLIVWREMSIISPSANQMPNKSETFKISSKSFGWIMVETDNTRDICICRD